MCGATISSHRNLGLTDIHAGKLFLCRAPQFFVLIVKVIHYVGGGCARVGCMLLPLAEAPFAQSHSRHRAAEALTLVQTNRALGYPTILQAMTEHVRSMADRNRGRSIGRVAGEASGGGSYEIRVWMRDQGSTGQWFEREFIWHADLALKKVNAASLPADGITPKEPDVAP